MRVCAHIVYGPFNFGHDRFDTISEAVEYFRNHVAGQDYGTGTDERTMDLYPWCSECSSQMNFHDYPMTRYEVGPRGAVRRGIV